MKTRIGIMMFGAVAGGWLLGACSEREGAWPEGEGGRISVSATVDRMEGRAGQEVSGGTFVLAYDAATGADALAQVPFEGTTGFPLVATGTAGVFRMLYWGDVKASDGNYVFTLDNIDNTVDAAVVTLDGTYGAQAEEDALNDILWGKLTVASSVSKTENLEFQLRHRMSKVSVIVNSGDPDISLGGDVTVKLSGIKTGVQSFNRVTGTVTAAAAIPGEGITLLDSQPLSAGGEAATPAWIVPPQTFGDARPTVEITVNGTTYSGQLGTHMVYGNSDTGVPAELAFEAGRYLKIKATFSKNVTGTELIFMPVMVEDWEDVGSISIVASQTGVYDEEDYAELVAAYNDNKDETILSKYGDEEDGKWTFRIFADIGKDQSLTDELRFGDDDFDISFNGHSVYGVTGDKDYLRTPGIYDEEDYEELVGTYNSDKSDDEKAQVLKKYGTYDDDAQKWTFSLKNSIGSADTGIPDNLKFKDNNFSMDFGSYTIYGKSDSTGLIKEDTEAEEGGIQS